MNKRERIFIIKKEKRDSSSLKCIRSYEHLNNIRRCPILWTCECRVVRSDLMSVCKEEKVFVHNNASNNNMITEMKHNRIINVKNKGMNDI